MTALKIENFSPPTEAPETFVDGKINPTVHGYDGPLKISIIGNVDPIDEKVVQVLQSKDFNMSVIDANDESALGACE